MYSSARSRGCRGRRTRARPTRIPTGIPLVSSDQRSCEISETFFELGGALGISILSSIGTAIYRGTIATQLPSGIPSDVAAAARDTLGAASGVARQLPDDLGAQLLALAHGAFVDGMQVAAVISMLVAIGVAVLALVALRDVGTSGAGSHGASDQEGEPETVAALAENVATAAD